MTLKSAVVYVNVVDSATMGTPATPLITGRTETSLSIDWETSLYAQSYKLERSTTGTSNWVSVYNGTLTECNDTGLASNTTYYYRVSGVAGTAVSTASPTVNATTLQTITAPVAPASLTASGTDYNSSDLTWAAVTNATSYRLQRAPATTGPWTTLYNGTALIYSDTTLTASTTYYYRAAALNNTVLGAWSATRQVITTAQTTGNVTPVASLRIVERTGVCAHPNFSSDGEVWKVGNATAFCSRVAAMGMGYIRGALPAASVADTWAAACRANGIKWLMTVVPESKSQPTDQSVATTISEVRRIRDNYSDICAGIEGINEPNDNRGTSAPPVPDDWATNATYGAITHQRAIWNAARDPLTTGAANPLKNVPIISSSLHDQASQSSYERTAAVAGLGGLKHYDQLAMGVDANGAAGLYGGLLDASGNLQYCTMIGLHTYPGGSFPLRSLDVMPDGTPGRLALINSAFGTNTPVWCTEHGWHNAMSYTSHRPISEAGAGTYGPRAILQFVTTVKKVGGGTDIARNLYYTYYEGLDDSQSLTVHEDRFGMYGVGEGVAGSGSATDPTNPATWRQKPVSSNIATMLTAMANPANTAAYTPAAVTCTVTCSASNHNLQYQVTATKAQSDAGTATLWIYRNMDIWDRNALTAITVPKVDISVTDRVGARSFTGTAGVDAEVKRIDLR